MIEQEQLCVQKQEEARAFVALFYIALVANGVPCKEDKQRVKNIRDACGEGGIGGLDSEWMIEKLQEMWPHE